MHKRGDIESKNIIIWKKNNKKTFKPHFCFRFLTWCWWCCCSCCCCCCCFLPLPQPADTVVVRELIHFSNIHTHTHTYTYGKHWLIVKVQSIKQQMQWPTTTASNKYSIKLEFFVAFLMFEKVTTCSYVHLYVELY